MTHLKVIIRVRPLSQREIEAGSIPVIEIQNKNTVAITNIKVPETNAGDSRQRVRRFTFDCCFPEDATQDDVFTKVEETVSKAIKRRYHSCVLAYGQSSTGKTHTMMGFPHDPGLTPRLSQRIFQYLQETALKNEMENMKTTVSYLEIYNEKVRDLLINDAKNNVRTLRVREHPKKGPYVHGLTENKVNDCNDLLNWIRLGNENRRVASTLSNSHSSRSHSVVTITCDGVKLHLVDLAGSERACSKSYTTSRFREGANINKSLVALGNVISALAEQPNNKSRLSQRRRFVPYRDSVLTWLLKDTLGGNSNTVMVATISPSSGCYSETVNTLRFGQRAKLIVSTPVSNEDPKEKIIRELRTEVAKLRELLEEAHLKINNRGHMLDFEPQVPLNIPNDFYQNSKTPSSSSFSSTIESSCITEKNQNYSDNQTDCDNSNLKQQQEQLLISNETLIPVMNVKTSIASDKKQIPKVRRTASVDFPMENSRKSSFGSHESLPTSKPPSVGGKVPPKTPKPLTTASKVLSSSNPILRRRSVDKPSSYIKTTLLQRKPFQESPKKLEKSVETDPIINSKNITAKPKIDSNRKLLTKPRSDIVASVTKRLYLKAKNKDSSTDMEGFDEPIVKNELPKELTICSNARLRLKEITQKALRAHRFRQAETQTETRVLRVKEIATDVQDLRQDLAEAKDAGTSTDRIEETEDKAVGCSFQEERFSEDLSESSSYVKVTKTVSVQCSEEMLEDVKVSKEHFPSRVSFTKYLQQNVPSPNIEFNKTNMASSVPNPIYANSVNINVSHHYNMNGTMRKIAAEGSLSDDSLEERDSNNSVLFPTPDLISNHNSLDPNIHAMQNEQQQSNNGGFKVVHALENVEENVEEIFFCEELKLMEKRTAEVGFATGVNEEIIAVAPQTITYAAELFNSSEAFYQECSVLATPLIEYGRANTLVGENYLMVPKSYQPNVLKSPQEENDDFDGFKQVPDSLEYHKVNSNKRVRFSTPKRKFDEEIFKAMSSFLEEATKLMSNISKAAEDHETSSKEFDLQISLEDINELENLIRAKGKAKEKQKKRIFSDGNYGRSYDEEESSMFLLHSNHFDIPSNRYDGLLEDSCKKLECRLNAMNRKRNLGDLEDVQMPSTSSRCRSLSEYSEIDEFSRESTNLSFSDYGSMNRSRSFNRGRRRSSGLNPSEFLRQLTSMRRKVMESSRSEIGKS